MSVSLALLLLLATAEPGQAPFTEPQPGSWSASAVYLWPGETALADRPSRGRRVTVPSPDGSLELVVVDSQGYLRPAGATRLGEPAFGVHDLAEVLWSPDSRALVITESDGGWVGTWSTTVYVFDGQRPAVIDVTAPVLHQFRRDSDACPDEYPNVVAVGWASAQSRLLVIVELPNHSSCERMGEILGYHFLVPTSEVSDQVGPNQLKAEHWDSLGPRLKAKFESDPIPDER